MNSAGVLEGTSNLLVVAPTSAGKSLIGKEPEVSLKSVEIFEA